MRLSVRDVFERLTAEGLAPAESAAKARTALAKRMADDMPWYLRIAVGLGAWAATGFFLGFIFAAAELRGDVLRIVVGVALVAVAVLVRRKTPSEFMRQSAVAASLAGQWLILYSVSELTHSGVVSGIAAALMAILLVAAMPDGVHRFLTTLLGVGGFMAAMLDGWGRNAIDVAFLAIVALTCWVWRGRVRERGAETAEMLEPVGYALIVALFAMLVVSLAERQGVGEIARELTRSRERAFLGPLTTVGLTLALVLLVWRVFDEIGIPLGSPAAFAALAGCVALGAGALSSPGIVAGAAVLVLAFDRRNPVLLGMAVVFLLVFGAAYYYNLDLTLLEKSGVLAGSGLLLLGIRARLVSRESSGGGGA